MIGKKQQIEQEEVRAARPVTVHALSILAAVAALAVSAAPASANDQWRKAPTPRTVHRLGAANDVGTLSLRNAPPKPRGMLDNPASGGF
jgi:hypothetical protein